MFDISICVPTYQRAGLLRQCLQVLAHFESRDFELLIGDNASGDGTAEVVEEFRPHFRHLVYLKHPENIGFARNMDALLRSASRKYVYIVSDDDLLYEGALRLARQVLETNDTVSAVVGGYTAVRSLDLEARVDYSDATATLFQQGEYPLLMDNLHVCDGQPFMRRATFEQHCSYLNRTGALIPLYFTLLTHGSLVVVNRPFFQHRNTGVSLSGRMADAWFLDMANADIELAVAQAMEVFPAEKVAAMRDKLLQLLYLQSARMSLHQKAPYLLWLFVKRLLAVRGAEPDFLLKCEHHFSHDFVLDRLQTMVVDAQFRRIGFCGGEIAQAMVAALSPLCPGIGFVPCDDASDPAPLDAVICSSRADLQAQAHQVRVIAIQEVFSQVRMTSHPCELGVFHARLVTLYREPAVNQTLGVATQAFSVLCSPY